MLSSEFTDLCNGVLGATDGHTAPLRSVRPSVDIPACLHDHRVDLPGPQYFPFRNAPFVELWTEDTDDLDHAGQRTAAVKLQRPEQPLTVTVTVGSCTPIMPRFIARSAQRKHGPPPPVQHVNLSSAASR